MNAMQMLFQVVNWNARSVIAKTNLFPRRRRKKAAAATKTKTIKTVSQTALYARTIPYHTYIYKTSHLNIFRMNTKNTIQPLSLCLICSNVCTVAIRLLRLKMNERRSFLQLHTYSSDCWLVAISCAIVTEKFQTKAFGYTHHYYVSIWRTIFVESRANTTFNVDSAYIIWHVDMVLVLHHFTREIERKTLFDKLLADSFCMHNAQLNIKLRKNGREREREREK